MLNTGQKIAEHLDNALYYCHHDPSETYRILALLREAINTDGTIIDSLVPDTVTVPDSAKIGTFQFRQGTNNA